MSEKAKISDTAALTPKKQTRDLALPVTALGLSTRATNALLNDDVRSVAQLVPRTEAELLGIPNFGRGALTELKKALARRKLRLGMVVPKTPSESTPPTSPEQTLLSDYLTPRQVAAELGICEKTLARWHAARRAPPRLTVGRKLLYRRATVSNWLQQQEKNR
jgi:predicted DNA-binding transcriptional regulator AlpA